MSNYDGEIGLRIREEEFAARRSQLAAELDGRGLAGGVLFDPFRILYYTGFAFVPTERPIAFVLATDGPSALLVPRLEVDHARAATAPGEVVSYEEYPGRQHPMDVLCEVLDGLGLRGRAGADMDGYPWIFGYRGPPVGGVTPIAGIIDDRMAVKSPAEIALLRESARWAIFAHELLQRYTRQGLGEREVAARASADATAALLEEIGPSYRAHDPWVDGALATYRGQIGRGAAIPHSLTGSSTFQAEDMLISGASVPMWGYRAELERTLVVGQPTAEQRRLFNHMLSLQDVALEAIRPGRRCMDVDLSVRDYYERHGLWDFWRHHSGHAVGLRYHEGPFLDVGDETVIMPGMVFAVEPGLYSTDVGGVRHSDTVVVTDEGIEILTAYPRDLESLTVPVVPDVL